MRKANPKRRIRNVPRKKLIKLEKFDQLLPVQGKEEKKLIKFKPLNNSQTELVQAIKNNDIVAVFGVAGTGKTNVSIAIGLEYIHAGIFEKIIVTRPALEVIGERLGFLPGNSAEKTSVYFAPLFCEALKYISKQDLDLYIKNGIIEIAPIAYLRGRTLDGYIICDESQNLTFEQIKMVLTRIGKNSKLIFNADPEQSDLRNFERGGLEDVFEMLEGIDRIKSVFMSDKDIVRNPLIGKILERINNKFCIEKNY